MLRPGELRQAEWREIDFETATWTIPVRRMKALKATKEENETNHIVTNHIVPLSDQAVKILQEIYPLTGKWEYVFLGRIVNKFRFTCRMNFNLCGENLTLTVAPCFYRKATHKMRF